MSSDVSPVVELTEVARSFADLNVLKPTSLAILPGEYVSIMGSSGSGKSTLLNLLGLLDRPTSGVVRMNGGDVDGLSDDDRSALRGRFLGFVFQAFHLIPSRSAIENVELGMLYRGLSASERRQRAEEALERVGLAARRRALPTTLSGGERQRVAIARALAARVSLLLADEPTGNLDAGTGERVLDLFDELHRDGLALVVVTHNPEVATRAQRRMLMTDGILSEAAA